MQLLNYENFIIFHIISPAYSLISNTLLSIYTSP